MSDYSKYQQEDLRLTLLKSLQGQPGFSSNESVLQKEAAEFGLQRSREVIRSEMRFLQSLGAVRLREVAEASVLIAILTARGDDHLKGFTRLEGVGPPTPRA